VRREGGRWGRKKYADDIYIIPSINITNGYQVSKPLLDEPRPPPTPRPPTSPFSLFVYLSSRYPHSSLSSLVVSVLRLFYVLRKMKGDGDRWNFGCWIDGWIV
jgi:hypothetical protein